MTDKGGTEPGTSRDVDGVESEAMVHSASGMALEVGANADVQLAFSGKLVLELVYFLRSIRVGTLDWARPFPADASSTSSAGNS